MLTYDFSLRGSLSLYEYLYRCIREDIRTGKLSAGTRLPSKRALAENNGISMMTVENAYGQLVAEGYIEPRPRSGFFVAKLISLPPTAREKTAGNFSPAVLPVSAPLLADLSSNQTRPESFPFQTWSGIIRRLLSEDQEKLLANAPSGGIPELREAIAEHLNGFRGMAVQPEQIFIGAGTEYLYGLLLQLLGLDKTYAVEDPGYSKAALIFRSHGAKCLPISMDTSGVQMDELQRLRVDVLHISPAHHFPTGRVMPAGRRHELLRWAADCRWIIEDDYDSEFRMTGRPIPPLQSIDEQGRVIYMNTFSKTLASTIRVSYMVLPLSLMERFRKELSFYSCTVSNMEQYTLARFISGGSFERHLNRMRTDYHRRRDTLLNLLQAHSDMITVSEEDAGLHFLITVKTPFTDEEFCARAAASGLRLNPLSIYYSNRAAAPVHCFVVNYSSLPQEVMKETVNRLCAAAKL